MYELLQEKLVPLKELKEDPEKALRGVVRIVGEDGHSRGIFLDNAALEDVMEDWLASDPEFTQLLEESRASGRISGPDVKRSLGLS